MNWSLLDDKEINDAMTKAALVAAGPDRNKAWADINKMIVEQAVAIPYVWDDNVTLWSKDVAGRDERVLRAVRTSRSPP